MTKPTSQPKADTITKAKTKRRRVWAVIDMNRDPLGVFIDRSQADAYCAADMGEYVARATLTWTPPAKAKKRRAKR